MVSKYNIRKGVMISLAHVFGCYFCFETEQYNKFWAQSKFDHKIILVNWDWFNQFTSSTSAVL